jgi:group I intron endonuclease
MIIYAVIKKTTDEIVYIGQTIQTLYKRKSKHLSDSRKGKGSVLGAAIRKHTINNFKFIELESHGTQAQLCAAEKHLIRTFKPKYNVQEGGKKSFTPWNKGKKETRPEVLEKISKSAKERKSPKRGKYKKSHIKNIRRAKLKNVEKEFKCLNNGKIYKNKVEAAQDLGIKAGGISAVLSNKTRNKTINGYTFVYTNNKGN